MGMDIQAALGRIAEKQDLTTEEMVSVMRQIMSAGSTDVQIGAFLLGMRIKGETIDEITGGVQVLREFASGVKVDGPNLVDIVGTGGDGANLFNVSTAACFVVAAAGGRVAKAWQPLGLFQLRQRRCARGRGCSSGYFTRTGRAMCQ